MIQHSFFSMSYDILSARIGNIKRSEWQCSANTVTLVLLCIHVKIGNTCNSVAYLVIGL